MINQNYKIPTSISHNNRHKCRGSKPVYSLTVKDCKTSWVGKTFLAAVGFEPTPPKRLVP